MFAPIRQLIALGQVEKKDGVIALTVTVAYAALLFTMFPYIPLFSVYAETGNLMDAVILHAAWDFAVYDSQMMWVLAGSAAYVLVVIIVMRAGRARAKKNADTAVAPYPHHWRD